MYNFHADYLPACIHLVLHLHLFCVFYIYISTVEEGRLLLKGSVGGRYTNNDVTYLFDCQKYLQNCDSYWTPTRNQNMHFENVSIFVLKTTQCFVFNSYICMNVFRKAVPGNFCFVMSMQIEIIFSLFFLFFILGYSSF